MLNDRFNPMYIIQLNRKERSSNVGRRRCTVVRTCMHLIPLCSGMMCYIEGEFYKWANHVPNIDLFHVFEIRIKQEL